MSDQNKSFKRSINSELQDLENETIDQNYQSNQNQLSMSPFMQLQITQSVMHSSRQQQQLRQKLKKKKKQKSNKQQIKKQFLPINKQIDQTNQSNRYIVKVKNPNSLSKEYEILVNNKQQSVKTFEQDNRIVLQNIMPQIEMSKSAQVICQKKLITQNKIEIITDLKENAQLGRKIIDFITQADQNRSNYVIELQIDINEILGLKKSLSFTDKIMQLLNKETSLKKQFFKDLFIGGTNLQKNGVIQKFQYSTNVQDKICFNPTISVTKQLFKSIRMSKGIHFIQQCSGIGKSTSFILYQLLNQLIYKYLSQLMKEKREQTTGGIKFNKEIEKFKLFMYPRLIYITLNRRTTPQTLIQSIVKQCQIDIERVKLQKINLKQDRFDKITLQKLYKQKFKNPVKLLLIVDQLNYLQEIFRQHSFYHSFSRQKIQQYSKNSQFKSFSQISKVIKTDILQKFKTSQQNIQQTNLNFINVKSLLQNLGNHFSSIFYISDFNISKEYIQILHLQTYSQQIIIQQPIKYYQKIQTVFTIVEMIDFYLFLVKQKIRNIKFYKSDAKLIESFMVNKKQMRDAIIQRINNCKIISFTPKNIQQVLTCNFYQSINNQDELIKQIIQRFFLIEKQSFESLKNRSNKFIHQYDSFNIQKNKLQLSIKLFYHIKNIERKFNLNQQIWKGYFIYNRIQKLQIPYIDRNLFKVTSIDSNNYRFQCLAPLTTITIILDYCISDEDFLLLTNAQILSLLNRSSLGSFIQNLILKILKFKYISWRYNHRIYCNTNDEVGGFQALSNKCQKQYFMDKIKLYMKQQSKTQSILLVPAKKNKLNNLFLNLQQRSSNSKAIDMIIAHNLNQSTILDSFDITISFTITNIKQKFSNFFESYFNFLDRNMKDSKIQLRYFLLIPDKCFNEKNMGKKMITVDDLQKLANEKLKFQQQQSNIFKVLPLTDQQRQLLTKIGIIKFRLDDLQFEQQNKGVRKYLQLIEDCGDMSDTN